MVWRIFRSWDKREYNLQQGTRAVVLPLCFFGLALSVAIALISVFNMEWIFTAPTRNSTQYGPNHPIAVWNGLYAQCAQFYDTNTGGSNINCWTIDYNNLGPSYNPTCYSGLESHYSTIAAIIFAGIGMCFFTGFLVWYRIRRLHRKPHRYRRDRRRTACSGLVTAALFLAAFIIFITGTSSKYSCAQAYDAGGAVGTASFFILAAGVVTCVVTALLWFANIRPPPSELEGHDALNEVQLDPAAPIAVESPEPPNEVAAKEPSPYFPKLLELHPQLLTMGTTFFLQSTEQLRRLAIDAEQGRERDSLFVRMDAEAKILEDRFPRVNPQLRDTHIKELTVESPRVLAADPPEKPPPAARSVGLRPTLGIEIKVTEGGPGEPAQVIAYRLADIGPAAQAGVEPGDVLMSWNGK
eukprot:EG_transcript_14044